MTDQDETAPPHGFVRKNITGDDTPARAVAKKARASERDGEINRQLAEIYENGDGSMPDMRHFEKKNRRTVLAAAVTLIVSCLFLGGVAWAGFFFFQPKGDFTEKDVIVTISGDEQVAIGASVKYRVRYRNDQNVPLSKVVLQVRYPEGFVFAESSREPANDARDEWTLGALDPYDSGYIDITGYFYSDVGSQVSLRAFLNYTPANFSSEFQKVATVAVSMTDSPVRIRVEGVNEAAVGANATLTLVVTGDRLPVSSTLPITLVFDPGNIFNKKTSEPASDQYQNYRWTFPSVMGEHRVVLHGTFTATDASTTAPLAISVLAKRPSDSRGAGFVIAKMEYPVRVVHADVSAHLVINGGVTDTTIAPGESLHASVTVQNTGTAPITKVRVRALLDSPSYKKKPMLNWSKLDDPRDGTITAEQINDATRRGTISWDSRQIADLKQLDPGEQVAIDFQLRLKGTDDEELPLYPAQDISALVDVQYESGGTKQLLSGNTMKLSVVSDATLKVQDTIEAGADGKETHAITWLLNNTFHPLRDIRLEADVYGDIVWDTAALKVPAGQARYDAGGKKVIWEIPEMPVSVDTFALQFAVTLNSKNPTQTQLSSKVKGSATDAVTGKQILFVGDEITLTR